MNYFWVYILRCSDGSYYTGHTDDIEKRISAHQLGKYGGYTAQRRPVELVFHQEAGSRDEAFVLERKLKGWSRKKKEALIRHDWNAIKELAQSKNPSTSSG